MLCFKYINLFTYIFLKNNDFKVIYLLVCEDEMIEMMK